MELDNHDILLLRQAGYKVEVNNGTEEYVVSQPDGKITKMTASDLKKIADSFVVNAVPVHSE